MMFAAGDAVGLAKWILKDSYLVFFLVFLATSPCLSLQSFLQSFCFLL